MNPCSKNKRSLALMAAGALAAATPPALREHLVSCAGCRQYWESMCALSGRLNSTELPHAELPESFHARLVRQIRNHEKAPPILIWLAGIRRLWSGRAFVTVTVGAALAIAFLVSWQNFREDKKRTSVSLAVQPISQAPTPPSPAPTLASYRRAANVSLENLDAVLAREIAPKPSTVETFTFSSLLDRSLED